MIFLWCLSLENLCVDWGLYFLEIFLFFFAFYCLKSPILTLRFNNFIFISAAVSDFVLDFFAAFNF